MEEDTVNNESIQEDGLEESNAANINEDGGTEEADVDMNDVEASVKSPTSRQMSERSSRGRQRGRRKKTPVIVQLPNKAITGLPECMQQELQKAFEIYTALRSVPKIAPFVERPSISMFGMSTYYHEISSPMWLDEVERKLLCQGYKCLSEFVLDIRLMLENCYKFWGAEHKFSKTALQIESKLENKLQALPDTLKEQCKNIYLDGCDNNEVLNSEENNSEESETNDPLRPKHRAFTSRILKKLSENGNINSIPAIDKEKEDKILTWERSHLGSADTKNSISSMWELAAIGVFLHLAHTSLNIKRIRQYEIERMFLIPKESTTLANIMTSMLSSATIRSKLDATVPLMSYEIWNDRLRRKLIDWFCSYENKNRNESEMFSSFGIETQFWRALSFENPYSKVDHFSEIPLKERCIIFKALCDNLVHTCKHIEDIFTSTSGETYISEDYSKEALLGNMEHYTYFYLPFWPDIRVYRTKSIAHKVWKTMTNISMLTNKLLEIFAVSDAHTSNNASTTELFTDFTLVAESPEDLLALIEQVKGVNLNMSNKLKKFNTKIKKLDPSHLPVLSLIWDQCDGHNIRASISDPESMKYWELSEDPVTNNYFSVEDPSVLGKRQRKINVSASMLSSEEEDDMFDEVPELEDDDGSDWECPSANSKKKQAKKVKPDSDPDKSASSEPKVKKKRGPKGPRKKNKVKVDPVEKKPRGTKAKCPPVEEASPNIDTQNVDTENITIDIKTETIEESNANSTPVKQESNIGSFRVELDDSDMDSQSTPDSKSEIKMEIKSEVKAESKYVVISLSSNDEDEDEDDVVPTTPVKQAAAVRSPSTPQIRTPIPVRPMVPVMTPTAKTPRRASPMMRSPAVGNHRLTSPVTPQHSPRMQFTTSPRLITSQPASPRIMSPRQMSPIRPGFPANRFTTPPQVVSSPRGRGVSPRGFTPTRPSTNNSPQVNRNLFTAARPPQPQAQPNSSTRSITAKLTFGKRDDGSYGYIARLPDGGVINISPVQISDIKKKHGGIPPVINIPL